jgi:hypothetical protein
VSSPVPTPPRHPDEGAALAAPAAARARRWRRLVPTTHAGRRRTVVAFGASVALAALAGVLPDAPVLTLAAILVGLWLGASLRLSVEATADLPDADLDERLVLERDSAYRAAYQVVGTVFLVVAVFGDILAAFLDLSALPGALLPSVPLLVLFAPSAVLAWRRPDLEVDA